jgi:hypothetical protein
MTKATLFTLGTSGTAEAIQTEPRLPLKNVFGRLGQTLRLVVGTAAAFMVAVGRTYAAFRTYQQLVSRRVPDEQAMRQALGVQLR